MFDVIEQYGFLPYIIGIVICAVLVITFAKKANS